MKVIVPVFCGEDELIGFTSPFLARTNMKNHRLIPRTLNPFSVTAKSDCSDILKKPNEEPLLKFDLSKYRKE